MHKKVD